jgi:hypothetical protein
MRLIDLRRPLAGFEQQTEIERFTKEIEQLRLIANTKVCTYQSLSFPHTAFVLENLYTGAINVFYGLASVHCKTSYLNGSPSSADLTVRPKTCGTDVGVCYDILDNLEVELKRYIINSIEAIAKNAHERLTKFSEGGKADFTFNFLQTILLFRMRYFTVDEEYAHSIEPQDQPIPHQLAIYVLQKTVEEKNELSHFGLYVKQSIERAVEREWVVVAHIMLFHFVNLYRTYHVLRHHFTQVCTKEFTRQGFVDSEFCGMDKPQLMDAVISELMFKNTMLFFDGLLRISEEREYAFTSEAGRQAQLPALKQDIDKRVALRLANGTRPLPAQIAKEATTPGGCAVL